MVKGSLKPSFLWGLFLSQIMNFDWCPECLSVVGGHFVPHHNFTWIQIMAEMATGCGAHQCHQAGTGRLSQAEQRQQPESQHQPGAESLACSCCYTKVLGAIQGTPPGLSAPSLLPPGAFLAPSRSGLWSHSQKRQLDVLGGQRGESHVNLKNIKMITSSRVTFLFIYRISQLCMTNFAQSHYLEQFV